MAGCGLFFTLGTFRLWQLTDLWRININYAAQQARCRGGLGRGVMGRETGRGWGRVYHCCGCGLLPVGCNCTTDDAATKSALNTYYVRRAEGEGEGEVSAYPLAGTLHFCKAQNSGAPATPSLAPPLPFSSCTLRPCTLSGVASLLSN